MKPKIIVAIPMGLPKKESVDSILNISYKPITFLFDASGETMPPGKTSMCCEERLQFIADARNRILERLMRLDFDFVLWIDSDIVVPPDIVDRLLSFTPAEKIIGAVYRCRGKGCTPCYFPLGDDEHASWVGFGCVLIAKEVHEKVGKFEIAKNCFGVQGEDSNFCRRARKLGYQIRVDSDTFVEHLA
jgi:GT2 family glycosyltransferase